jgi:hypothetical protein
VVQAANVHEAKDQVWLADLTGQMMREGTTALTADAVAREFAAMGGQLGIGVQEFLWQPAGLRAEDQIVVFLVASPSERSACSFGKVEKILGDILA